MAKNMKEAEGFNNMFASLGFGIDTKAKKKEDTNSSKESAESDKNQKKVSETAREVKNKSGEEKKQAAKTVQDKSGNVEKPETKVKSGNNSSEKETARISSEKVTDSSNKQSDSAHNAAEKKAVDQRISVNEEAKADKADHTSETIDSKDRIDQTETIEETPSKTKSRQPVNSESSENENTSVRLYARNKRYFEIRAAQLGVSQMEYINFLLEEEEKREAAEDIDPFSIELPKKESTSIKALVLTKHNMEFLRSASANLGMKMTQFINWMLDNERKMEKEKGPRQSIEKWSAIQNEEQ
ncbi:MAG: hypothetical protein PUE58_06630 [Lachnospiraceae bacterium]|nr:hypothetical protein [Lachnospiraceae bacterium]